MKALGRRRPLDGVTPLPFGLAWVARELRPCKSIVCLGRVWEPFLGPLFIRRDGR